MKISFKYKLYIFNILFWFNILINDRILNKALALRELKNARKL